MPPRRQTFNSISAALAAAAAAAQDNTLVQVPKDNSATPIMTITKDVKTFMSYADFPYTLLWDPAVLFVGRVVSGCQLGPGTISFQPTPGASITFINKNGSIVPNGSPAVFQGGGGMVVCTEKTATSATLRVVIGEFGSPQLQLIPQDYVGLAANQAGVTQVISYSKNEVQYDFDPEIYSPLGYSRQFIQVGPGTLTLVQHPNANVIFLLPDSTEVTSYTISQGENVSVTCIAQTAGSITLQIY
jgi:hypothetical protein